MKIERFDPHADRDRMQACFDLTMTSWPVDNPNSPPWAADSFTAKWIGFDGSPQQAWLAASESGAPLGCYLLRLPDKENLTRASCSLAVGLEHRRAGLGRTLLAHCADQARQVGRAQLSSAVRDGSAGAGFAAAIGAKPGIANVFRVLDIDAALPSRVAELRTATLPPAAGYSLLSWVGLTPEEYLAASVPVHDAMADAPRDPGHEPHVVDADRIRRTEQTAAEHGIQQHTVAAQHDATGDIVALTQVATDAGVPDWGFQLITAVLPEHRGHRLGLLVKLAMLDLLAQQEPQVRRIFTGNAGSNEHMIAINAQLGFEVKDTYRDWELELGR
jgi:GNAT superfamily N-acetyltransferase